MKLRNKFLLYMLIPVLIAVCAGLVGTYVNSLLSKEFSYVTGNLVPALTQLGELKSSANALRDIVVNEQLSELDSSAQEVASQRYLHQHLEIFTANANYYARHAPDSTNDSSLSELRTLTHRLMRGYQRVVAGVQDPTTAVFRRQVIDDTQRLNSLVDLRVKIEVVGLNEREAIANGQLRRLSRFNIITLVIAFVLAYTIAVLLAGTMVTPILHMRDVAAEFGRGRLSNRVRVRQKDELGELGESLNQMAADIAARTVSKEYVDGIVNSMATMLIVVDRQGVIQTINPAFSRQLGYSETEIVGKHISQVCPDTEPYLRFAETGVITEFTSEVAFEAYLVSSDGSKRLGNFHVAQVEAAERDTERIVCVVQDITDSRELEKERAAFRDHLRHAEQLSSLGTMSAIVAHRLRQPLTSTYLFLQDTRKELALEKPNLTTIATSIEWSLKEVERASATIKNVLAFAHSSKVEHLEQCNVAETVARVVGVLKDKADAVGMHIETQGEQQVSIEGFPGDLQQIVFTIAQNAIQEAATREEASLRITWELVEQDILLSFEDTCGGIPKENIDQIFDLFFSTKVIGEGTGLGLCIVQQIVTRLGGEVEVESSYPIGAKFIVRIPVQSDAATC